MVSGNNRLGRNHPFFQTCLLLLSSFGTTIRAAGSLFRSKQQINRWFRPHRFPSILPLMAAMSCSISRCSSFIRKLKSRSERRTFRIISISFSFGISAAAGFDMGRSLSNLDGGRQNHNPLVQRFLVGFCCALLGGQ